MRTLFLLAVFGLVGWTMARTIRDRASRSPALQRRLLIRGCIALVLGLVIALWLPGRVPETPGSPATLVAILVLWVVGGGLAYLGLVTLLGTLLARPAAADATNPPSL